MIFRKSIDSVDMEDQFKVCKARQTYGDGKKKRVFEMDGFDQKIYLNINLKKLLELVCFISIIN